MWHDIYFDERYPTEGSVTLCSFVRASSICNERSSHNKIDGGPRVFTNDYTTTSGYLTKLPGNPNVNENALGQISSNFISWHLSSSWWRHQMETFSALLAICVGNSPVTGEFPAQRPVTCSFDVSFDLRLNKRLSKQSWGWWFETLSHPLWRHCDDGCTSALLPALACRLFTTEQLPKQDWLWAV